LHITIKKSNLKKYESKDLFTSFANTNLKMKLFNLANILTLVNLFAGCAALILVFSPSYQVGTLSDGLEYVPYFTLLSLVADYFDGMAARYTQSISSGIGRELDSLADVVSFGVVPAAVLYSLLTFYFKSVGAGGSDCLIMLYSSPAFLVALFSALRLAKFNIDTRQTESFIGLATPANTIFVMGLLLVFLHNDYHLTHILLHPFLLFGLIAGICYLLISEIPMFSFKFKTFGWSGNEVRYMFIIASLLLLAGFKFAGISLAVVLYILTSVVIVFIKPHRAQ
jgi:CDP-diacylglycerol--serine O-phosphatidyltransferase